ncbi:MAG: DUF3572 family protein [Pseudomonadota bacterium]
MEARAAAERIAIAGLDFLGRDPERLDRFLRNTGLTIGELRQAAGEDGFLVGVLAHFLADDSLLMAFAADDDIDPETIASAHDVLSEPHVD